MFILRWLWLMILESYIRKQAAEDTLQGKRHARVTARSLLGEPPPPLSRDQLALLHEFEVLRARADLAEHRNAPDADACAAKLHLTWCSLFDIIEQAEELEQYEREEAYLITCYESVQAEIRSNKNKRATSPGR